MSDKNQIEWILQIEGGRLLGPLKTEEILNRINKGVLTGEEKIKKHPDGHWVKISREPAFYDSLLSALEKTVEENQNDKTKPAISIKELDKKNSSIEANFTPEVFKPVRLVHLQEPERIDPEKISHIDEVERTQIDFQAQNTNNVLIDQDSSQQNNENPYLKPKDSHQDKTEMATPNLGVPPPNIPRKVNSNKNQFRLVGLLLLSLLVIVVYFLISEKSIESDRIRLKIPRPGMKTTLKSDEVTKLMKAAYERYFKDSVLDYLAAQDILIKIIEGDPQLAEPRGVLCLTQLELWPFVKQNAKDIDTIQVVRKGARLLDPVGLNGLHCEISYLMTMGKYKEALGVINNFSNRDDVKNVSENRLGALYLAKAEILGADHNYKEAINWALTALEEWPGWIKAMFLTAKFYTETNQIEFAAKMYEQILTQNPNHKKSLIEYGAILFSKTNNKEAALKIILRAIDTKDDIPKDLESKAYFILSQIFESKGQPEKALHYAEVGFSLNPGDIRLRDFLIQLGGSPTAIIKKSKNNELVFLGDQYFRAGDFLSAQAVYKTAFDYDSQNAIAAMKTAKCLWQLSQTGEALSWLKKAIAADPKFSLPYYLAADYYSQRFDFQNAVETLNIGLKHIKNNSDILRGYGLVEVRRNNGKDAIAYLEQAKKLFENDVETLILLAKAYGQRGKDGDIEKAVQTIVRAIQLEDTNIEAQVTYAKILVQTKGTEQGIFYLKELLNKYSYSIDFRIGLADIYKQTERFQEALELYEQSHLIEPKNKKALMGAAECYQAITKLDKALKFYLEAAVLDPSDPEPIFKAGLVYMDAGRFKEALDQFERGLKINPSYPRGYYYMGKVAYAQKNYEKALSAAEKEKKINPNMADAYILSGQIYFALNDFMKCASEYQKAIQIQQTGAENHVKMAYCQYSAGNLDIAESMLNIAAQKESGYADIYKIQGLIYEKRGDNQLAVEAYNKYLVLAPNAPEKSDVESRIVKLGGKVEN